MKDKTTTILEKHLVETFNEDKIREAKHRFSKEGFLKIKNIVPEELKKDVYKEIYSLLEKHAERRDITLETTDNTPRYLNIVRSEVIENSDLLVNIRTNKVLLDFLQKITQEEMHLKVTDDEEFVITKQEFKGDTHGWHWGDYSFALIWIVEVPDVSAGGMLQCIPHTSWNKENAKINQYLCDNQITTYSFVPGDVYLLKADTTLHRTVPLSRDGTTRVMLNMTWASERDYGKLSLQNDDRWWDNADAKQAIKVDKEI